MLYIARRKAQLDWKPHRNIPDVNVTSKLESLNNRDLPTFTWRHGQPKGIVLGEQSITLEET